MPSLPVSPSLDQLKRQARDLLRAALSGDPAALTRIARYLPGLPAVAVSLAPQASAPAPRLSHALFVLAREYGFPSWPKLKAFVLASASKAEALSTSAPTLSRPRGRGRHTQALADLAQHLADRAAQEDTAAVTAALRVLARRDTDTVRALLVEGGAFSKVVECLLAGLASPLSRLRFDCAHALDHFADERCVGPLLALLDDPVPRVRREALHALSCEACKLAPLPVSDALSARVLGHALGDSSISVRRHATAALGSFGDEDTRTVLRSLARQDADICVRREARWALSRCRGR